MQYSRQSFTLLYEVIAVTPPSAQHGQNNKVKDYSLIAQVDGSSVT